MRVLFLHQFDLDLAGGSGTYLRLLASGLAAAGHNVDVVAAKCDDRHGVTTFELPFEFTLTFGPERRPGERTFDEFTIVELQRMSNLAADSIEHQAFSCHPPPNLILVNHVSMQAEVARQLSQRHGIPYRIISYGTDGEFLQRDNRYVDWLRPAVDQAEQIFAISEFIARHLREVLPGIVVRVLGGAVDTNIFRASKPRLATNRCAYVGRLVSEKGIDTLFQALEYVRDDIVLDVVGEGPLLETLRTSVECKRLDGRVNFLGYLSPCRVRDVLFESSVLIVPSVWEEPLGLVVLEAIACGVPVVATDVGGIPEIVKPDRNGLLVEPDNPKALANAISQILDDTEFHAQLVDGCLNGNRPASPTDLASRVLT